MSTTRNGIGIELPTHPGGGAFIVPDDDAGRAVREGAGHTDVAVRHNVS
jgi:hypothetical protein